MNNVQNLRENQQEMAEIQARIRGLEPPGGPPHNGDMGQRVAKLEAIIPTLATREDLMRETSLLKADLARIEGTLRAEIHKAINEQTWKLITWMSSIALALVSATYFIATHLT